MTASGMASPPTAALAHRVSMSVRAGGRPPGAWPETGPRDLGSRCPRSGGADEERSERPPGRERAPQEATPDLGCMGPKDPAWFSAAPLTDGLDDQLDPARRHLDRDPVARAPAQERAADRGLDRYAPGRGVRLDRAHEVIGARLALVVLDHEGGARLGDPGAPAHDDLGSPDHLLELVDAVVEPGHLLLRLLQLRVVLDVARLGGLLHPLEGVDPSCPYLLEILLELCEARSSQQDWFAQVHAPGE